MRKFSNELVSHNGRRPSCKSNNGSSSLHFSYNNNNNNNNNKNGKKKIKQLKSRYKFQYTIGHTRKNYYE